MSCWALIPVKARGLGKQRLASVLSTRERAALVDAMLAHVLACVREARTIERVAIVSPQPCAAHAVWLPDPGDGLNAALGFASELLRRRGAQELVVISADLPELTAPELDAFVAGGRRAGAALAPDHTRAGTNALYLHAPFAIEYRFGPGSCRAHRRARALGDTPHVSHAPGLARDIDLPGDLARWRLTCERRRLQNPQSA